VWQSAKGEVQTNKTSVPSQRPSIFSISTPPERCEIAYPLQWKLSNPPATLKRGGKGSWSRYAWPLAGCRFAWLALFSCKQFGDIHTHIEHQAVRAEGHTARHANLRSPKSGRFEADPGIDAVLTCQPRACSQILVRESVVAVA